MPLELVAIEPRKPILRGYTDEPLEPNQVRFKTEFAAAKHGTEHRPISKRICWYPSAIRWRMANVFS